MRLGRRGRALLPVCVLAIGLLLGTTTTAFAAGPATWVTSPAAGSVVSDPRPLISATAHDTIALRNWPATTFTMKLDGKPVKPTFTFAPGDPKTATLSYLPPAGLSYGVHTVYAWLSNTSAVYSDITFSFTVSAPPALGTLSPADGSTSVTDRPTITAKVTPNSPSLTACSMSVDGAAVTPTWNAAAGLLSYTPTSALRNDTAHAVAVSVTNSAGRTTQVSWSFNVQIYAEMADTAGCTGCHLAYPLLHPMDDCDGCHGENSPVGEWWSTPYYSAHSSSWLSGSCVSCHNSYYPNVPRHTGTVAVTHVTATDMSGCACHVRSLTIEHARRLASGGGPITCVACHTSTDGRVIAAIANGSTLCTDCHLNAQHESLHEVLIPPTCTGAECHSGTALTAIHVAPGCAGCHASSDPQVVVAIAGGNRDCTACHGSVDHEPLHTVTVPGSCVSCHAGTSLTGIHATPGCAGCHRSSDPEVAAAIAGGNRGCAACHVVAGVDFHAGMGAAHLSPTTPSCFGAGCHDASKSLPAVHALYVGPGSEFPAYATSCELCHANVDPGRIDWAHATAGCTGVCHSGTTHSRYAARHTVTALSAECAQCHGTDLTGIHGAYTDTTRCALCHADPGNFAKTADCLSCHAGKSPVPINHFPVERHVGTSGPDCAGCHDLDLAAEHAKASSGSITCAGCHTSSKFAALTRPWDGTCSACHGADHQLGAAFCAGCHTDGRGTYAGSATFASTKHGSAAGSSLAAVSWPGTTYAAGSCVNCHGSHTAQTRVAGEALCYGCHDAAGTTKPPTYSYQGSARYAASAHEALGSCATCHAAHGALDASGALVASGLKSAEPAVCTGTQATPGCHASPSNAANGTNVLAAFEASGGATTHHDVNASSAGHIVCSSCHDPHTDTASLPYANPAAIGAAPAGALDRFTDAGGHVYALVGAKHDGRPPVITGFTVTGLPSSPAMRTFSWYTDEPATAHMQYGPTTAYGTTKTIDLGYSLYRATSITFPIGTITHYRARSADQLGNVTYTPDATYYVPWTYLITAPAVTGGTGGTTVTVTWTTAGACESWVDYGLDTTYGSTVGTSTNTTSHVVKLTGLSPGTYHLRARSLRAGDTYTSGDLTVVVTPSYATAPVLTPIPGNAAIPGPLPIAFKWTQPNTTYAPFTYQVHVWDPYNLYDYTSSWLTTNTMQLTLDGDHDYYWTVRAKDKDGLLYPLSSTGYFYLYYYVAGGSCPFLFTWDGAAFAFEADNFTAGRLGGPTATGYQQPNPNDAYILKNVPAAEDGSLKFNLVEERREVDYLDSYRLYAVDAPAGTQIYAEKAVAGKRTFPPLASALHTVSSLRAPLSAVRTDTGEDVLSQVTTQGSGFVALNEDAEATFTYKTIEMDLGADVATAPQVKVVMDALSEFPVTPEGIARRFTFGLPAKFEVQDTSGAWRSVPTSVGSVPTPPEFERPYVFDITSAVRGTTGKVRFTYLFRTLVDWIAVDTSADASLTVAEVPLDGAQLGYHGVDGQTASGYAGRYAYGGDPKTGFYYPGDYTRYGEVAPLLTGADDKFVVMGQGDQISLSYAAPAAPAAGTSRSYVFSAYGYYKDNKTDLPKEVAPLPFQAMSNYPYSASESYPTDAEHQDYLATYNTRHEDGPSHTVERSPLSLLIESAQDLFAGLTDRIGETIAALFAPKAPAAAATARASSPDEELAFSVDTDRIAIAIPHGASSRVVTAAAGWQTASDVGSPPTPAAPGTPVSAATLTQGTNADYVAWRTDLTAVDARFNWQMARFDTTAGALAGATGLGVQWVGHGEPTAGYPVNLYLWDFRASKWVQVSQGQGSWWFSLLGTERQAGEQQFCIACHRLEPPAGASGATAYANMVAGWAVDRHGDGSGSGVGGSLKAPYARGNGPLECSVCHDPHGSSNSYHLKTGINGTSGVVVGTGNQFQNACAACHTGTVTEWHDAACHSCHSNAGHGSGGPTIDSTTDCSTCHKHGVVWAHPEMGCHGCDDPAGASWPTF